MIEEAGAWGWMADFGEYLPFDSVSHKPGNPFVLHNEYAREWVKVM